MLTQKDIKTTMVGAIASFEDWFGEDWGHGLSYSELTEEQKKNRKRWDACRNEILTKGNNIIRKNS